MISTLSLSLSPFSLDDLVRGTCTRAHMEAGENDS